MRLGACLATLTLALSAVTTGIALASPQHGSQLRQPQQQARPAEEDTASQNTLRDNWDSNEPGLSPTTLQGGHFGQIFATPVSGQVYAQPLVVDHSGLASDVIVATEGDNVYSLNGNTGKVNWSQHLGTPWSASVNGCPDLTPYIGITSTPVYDPASHLLYLVALIAGSNTLTPTPTYYVYAINEQTGAIAWHVPVQGTPTNAPSEPFRASQVRQRTGLLLMNGSVYFAFSSYCDYAPYVGSVAGMNVTSHAQTLWSPETGSASDEGGIWMSGSGLMSDGSGQILFATGNGVSPPAGAGNNPPGELGDSVVRLAVQSNGSLKAVDYFSPVNAPTLDANDGDLGAGGTVGLPFGTSTYPNLLVQAGKDHRVFLLNRNALGGRSQGPGGTDNVVFVGGPFGDQWDHPAAYAGGGGWDYVYYSPTGESSSDYLHVLHFNGHTSAHPILEDVANSPGKFGFSSGSPVITSNGNVNSSAVLWEVYTSGSSGAGARLEAYNAVPAAGSATLTELWSAPISVSSRFEVPATDGNHVYVGNRNDGVHASNATVYGFGVTGTAAAAAQVSFGPVAVDGAAKTMTATLTANQAMKITGLSASSTGSTVPFTAGTPALNGKAVTFPVALTAGQQLTVPVTFTPTTADAVTGSLDLATNLTSDPTVSVPLTGTGTKPGLAAFPTSLPFGSTVNIADSLFNGPVPIGRTQTFETTITNTGTTPETITSITQPGGPFAVSGLKAGTVLRPGEADVELVTYTPSKATGSDSGSFTIGDSAGHTVTVPLTGISVAGNGVLVSSAPTVNFGAVKVGTSATDIVHITNTGNLPVTVSLFLTPATPFSTPVPLAKGLSISPGQIVAIPVQLTPRARGSFSGAYQIAATYGTGKTVKVTVNVTGSGT